MSKDALTPRGFLAKIISLAAIVLAAMILFYSLEVSAVRVADSHTAVLLNIKGGIGPAVQDYVHRSLAEATTSRAPLVIIQLDTPGGLSKSMRGIIKDILAAKMPVVTYVAPSGARAASAGTYILYASHIAAMAPGTNLGAATPVAIGMPGVGSGGDKNKDKEKGKGNGAKTALARKATSDAKAYIRALAQLRGRNVAWAEEAVQKAASLTAKEALKANVIDVVADSIPDLLKQINGRQVKLAQGRVTIHTDGLQVQAKNPDWRSRFLAVITDPSIAYILLLAGIYGLFFEFANPGLILPGVVGAICLLIALYALQLLPISYVGLALILIGIVFIVAEAFVSSFGVLGIGGVIAFLIGSIMLLDTDVPGFSIALPVILTLTGVTAAFFLMVVNMALRSRYRPAVSGQEAIVGEQGRIHITPDGRTTVRLLGESWNVESHEALKEGELVTVNEVDGLLLKVTPVKEGK